MAKKVKQKFGGSGAPSKTIQVRPTVQRDIVNWLQDEADKSVEAVSLGTVKSKSKFAPKLFK